MEKQEFQKGVYLAGAITKIQAGYAITSIANINSEEVEIDEPVLEVAEIEPGTEEHPQERDVSRRPLHRTEEVFKRLRLDHSNTEEKKQVEKTCAAYQDISFAS
jgi:hypothetical protein